MDGGHHLERHQRDEPEHTQELSVRQRRQACTDARFERKHVLFIFVYMNADPRCGLQETESIFHILREEGRDVEHLVCAVLRPPVHGTAVRRGEYVVMHLTEGVAHLADHRTQAAIPVLAVPDAQGVEDISQHPREAKQADPTTLEIHAAPPELALGPGARSAVPSRPP